MCLPIYILFLIYPTLFTEIIEGTFRSYLSFIEVELYNFLIKVFNLSLGLLLTNLSNLYTDLFAVLHELSDRFR